MYPNPSYQHVPIEEQYEIFVEKCHDEDIKPPTFEVFARRNLGYTPVHKHIKI